MSLAGLEISFEFTYRNGYHELRWISVMAENCNMGCADVHHNRAAVLSEVESNLKISRESFSQTFSLKDSS